jgi:tetratricopeptide (TPR) repeat protein
VARKGARVLDETKAESAGREREPKKGRPSSGPRTTKPDEVWIFEAVVEDAPPRGRRKSRAAPAPDDAGSAAAATAGRQARSSAKESALPSEVVNELAAAVGRDNASRLSERMEAAARAYERDRYAEAFRITKNLVDQVPESAAARELHGLVCYRLGRWTQAIGHLEAARKLDDDDTSQIPVMMDCHRALHRHRRVAALWEELRASSPSPDILAEGRMVLASDLADQRKLNAAVEVLASSGAARNLRHPSDRHVRQWYVLADLYERAGDSAHARELFGRVAAADPELADAADRYAELGRRNRRPRTPARPPVKRGSAR